MLLLELVGLVVENDEVAVLEVEPVQLVAGGFRVHDIFVDDEGRAFGVAGDALADLTAGLLVVLSHRGRVADANRIGPNFPKRSNRSSVETLYERFLTKRALHVLLVKLFPEFADGGGLTDSPGDLP